MYTSCGAYDTRLREKLKPSGTLGLQRCHLTPPLAHTTIVLLYFAKRHCFDLSL